MPQGARPCSGSSLRRAGARWPHRRLELIPFSPPAPSPPGARTLQSIGPIPAQGMHPSAHRPHPCPRHTPFSPPAPSPPGARTLQSNGARLSLGPWGSRQPGQPRRMDSLSEPSRPTSFTSAEKGRVGVRALVAGPTTGRLSQECLPQGDLLPRLWLVSLVSDEGSAWQRASCLCWALVRWGGHAWAWNPPGPIPSPPPPCCVSGQVTQPL